MQYKNLRNAYCNQEKVIFPGVGPYDIPEIKPVDLSLEGLELVRFDKCLRVAHPENKVVHFFTDDYVFDRVWREPERYMTVLSRFRAVIAPDFSIYTDYPLVVQLYNHFRKHWLAAYWQSAGLTVLPSIRWQVGSPGGFAWCLDGEPHGGTICVSTLGAIKGQWRKDDFLQSLQQAIYTLAPSRLIIVGDTFPGLAGLGYSGPVELYNNSELTKRRGGGKMGAGSSGDRGGTADNINWEDNAPRGYHVLNDNDVDKAMTVQSWEKGLTDGENTALHMYTSVDDVADTINDSLRSGVEPRGYKNTVDNLEKALDKGYLRQNTILHRVGDSDLLGGAKTVDDVKKMIGSVVQDDGFTSTSATPNSDKYPYKKDRMAFHIKTRQGKGIGAFVKGHSEYNWEQEFLFNRGSAFRIDGAWKDNTGLVHVNMEYVGRAK